MKYLLECNAIANTDFHFLRNYSCQTHIPSWVVKLPDQYNMYPFPEKNPELKKYKLLLNLNQDLLSSCRKFASQELLVFSKNFTAYFRNRSNLNFADTLVAVLKGIIRSSR